MVNYSSRTLTHPTIAVWFLVVIDPRLLFGYGTHYMYASTMQYPFELELESDHSQLSHSIWFHFLKKCSSITSPV